MTNGSKLKYICDYIMDEARMARLIEKIERILLFIVTPMVLYLLIESIIVFARVPS